MSNHFHLVLRSRPDLVATWSDEEVARIWLCLCPGRRTKDGSPPKPTRAQIAALAKDSERIAVLRLRLSDISWFMKLVSEYIARKCNREDGVTGHFWEGRFKARLILDEPSLFACAAYVDLNPVRAGIAETPEQSDYTSAKDRVDDLSARGRAEYDDLHAWERGGQLNRSDWLAPIQIDESTDPAGPDPCPTSRRASRKGFLPISLPEYLQLLDWTGRQIRADKPGAIPEELAPILVRIGLDASQWCALVAQFSDCFKRAAGTQQSLNQEAERRGQRWLQAPGNPLTTAA